MSTKENKFYKLNLVLFFIAQFIIFSVFIIGLFFLIIGLSESFINNNINADEFLVLIIISVNLLLILIGLLSLSSAKQRYINKIKEYDEEKIAIKNKKRTRKLIIISSISLVIISIYSVSIYVKNQELDNYISTANDLILAKNYESAGEQLNLAKNMKISDLFYIEKLDIIEEELEEKKLLEINMSRIKEYLASNDFSEAHICLDETLSNNPDNKELLQLKEELINKEEEYNTPKLMTDEEVLYLVYNKFYSKYELIGMKRGSIYNNNIALELKGSKENTFISIAILSQSMYEPHKEYRIEGHEYCYIKVSSIMPTHAACFGDYTIDKETGEIFSPITGELEKIN